jgi:hypothetical protein
MKDFETKLTVDRLKEILSYDPNTGVFLWRMSRGPRRAGEEAGTFREGYRIVRIKDFGYSAHRLAWLYVYGEWPPSIIDHKNGYKADNRIENLRICTYSQNLANQKTSKNNSSGVKGITWARRQKRWRAQIRLNGKNKALGYFKEKEAAILAYANAAEQLFGKFANYHVVL